MAAPNDHPPRHPVSATVDALGTRLAPGPALVDRDPDRIRAEALVSDLSRRTAREVLDDHLNIANTWVGGEPFDRVLDEDLRRNVSDDIVVLINRGVYRGHEGVRELAWMLADELPEHRAFQYTHVAAEGRIAFLEWTYEDAQVRVRDGADSYVIENGKIVAQTIHYTVEPIDPSSRPRQ
ncbi:MAG: nuclear transport factor 2 family protein [Nocardioides sp.]